MDKPVHNNGYTLMEMLVVLLIVTLFSIPVSLQKDHLILFMKKMKMYSIAVQCNAFQLKEVKTIRIGNKEALFDDKLFHYPDTISCSSVTFHYNENGNISQALSYTCKDSSHKMKMIYQLGSGRVRYE